MKDKLVVEFEREGVWRIQWLLAEDQDWGGHLCQDMDDGMGEAPKNREEWEHWAASKAVRATPGFSFDHTGAKWESEREARSALRVAKEALKQERPLPDWAQKALEAGWKPPKGWKA